MQFPPLRGGVFFKALLGYRKPRVSHKKNYSGEDDPLADRRVLLALIHVTDPDFPAPKDSTLKSNTSTFMNCRDEIPSTLPFENAGFVASFNGQMKDRYSTLLYQMQEFLEYLIGMDDSYKHEALVRDLLEIIENDPDSKGQPMYIGQSGEVLVPGSSFHFVSFILGVWFYVISSQASNKLDNDLFDDWALSKSKGRSITREINMIPQKVSEPNDPEPVVTDTETVDDDPNNNAAGPEVIEVVNVNPDTGEKNVAHIQIVNNGSGPVIAQANGLVININ